LIRREDDDATVLQMRLAEFRSKTEPLLSFYEKDEALHRIDGNRDREAVFADIAALIEERTR
jgi:adenylate kinase